MRWFDGGPLRMGVVAPVFVVIVTLVVLLLAQPAASRRDGVGSSVDEPTSGQVTTTPSPPSTAGESG